MKKESLCNKQVLILINIVHQQMGVGLAKERLITETQRLPLLNLAHPHWSNALLQGTVWETSKKNKRPKRYCSGCRQMVIKEKMQWFGLPAMLPSGSSIVFKVSYAYFPQE